MAIVTSVTYPVKYSDVVKYEQMPEFAWCRERVVALEGSAKTYAVGTVLGKISASGKYRIQDAASVDGSEVAAVVVAEDKAVPATTDTSVLAFVRGDLILNKALLVVGAGTDTAPELQAVYDALAAKRILVNTGLAIA
jgi:hypothetical protein